jgi:cytochrome c551/c552
MMAGILLTGADVKAEEGKVFFESLRCGSCHKLDTGKVNPSLKEIAAAYEGKKDHLLSYLKGEAPSVVVPDKGERMKRYIEKTKALNDEERKALADFTPALHKYSIKPIHRCA